MKKSNIIINGFLDAFDQKTKTLWEFKVVSEVTTEMYLQVAIYGYMLKVRKQNPNAIKLFNLFDKTVHEFELDYAWFEKYLKKLVAFKMSTNMICSTRDFLKEVNEYE